MSLGRTAVQPLRRPSAQPLRRDRALKRGLSFCSPAGQTACLSARLRPGGFVSQRSCLTFVIVCDAVALLVAWICLLGPWAVATEPATALRPLRLVRRALHLPPPFSSSSPPGCWRRYVFWEAGRRNDEVVPRCWQCDCSQRLIALGLAPSFLAQCWSGHMYRLVCACFFGVVCLQVGWYERASWLSFVCISSNLARH